MKNQENCRICQIQLNGNNWYPSFKKLNNNLCKNCNQKRTDEWRKSNPELNKQLAHNYRTKHRSKRAKTKKDWDTRNKEHNRIYDSERRKRLRKTTLDAYGNVCACCGETNQEFLTIDHVNGDGAAHRKQLKSRSTSHIHVYLRKLNYPKDRFRLLCYNCNISRGHYGYCPHEKIT